MIKRLPLLLRHVMYNLRGGFLVRPLAIAADAGLRRSVAVVAGRSFPASAPGCPAAFPFARRSASSTSHSRGHRDLHHDGRVHRFCHPADDADVSFHAVLAANHREFLHATAVTQWTLGIFLGTFSYCMAALPAARSFPSPVRSGRHRYGRDGAGVRVRGLAAVLHPPHFASHQREPHRGPHRL